MDKSINHTINKAGFLLQVAAKLPSASEIEDIRIAAKDEGYNEGRKIGFESGLKEGLKEGKKRIDLEANRLAVYIKNIMLPIENQQRLIIEAMQTMAVSVTEKIIKTQLQSNPEWIIPLLEQCLEQLPIGNSQIQIRIPEIDFEKISTAIKQLPQFNSSWTLISDSKIQPTRLMVEALPSKITIDINEVVKNYFKEVYKNTTIDLNPGEHV